MIHDRYYVLEIHAKMSENLFDVGCGLWGDDDNADDVDADADVGKEQEGDNSDSSHGKTNVPPELKTNDFVGFPGSVDLAVEST